LKQQLLHSKVTVPNGNDFDDPLPYTHCIESQLIQQTSCNWAQQEKATEK